MAAEGTLSASLGGLFRGVQGGWVSKGGVWVPPVAAWVSQGSAWVPINLGNELRYFTITLELLGTAQSGQLRATLLDSTTGLPVADHPISMVMDYCVSGSSSYFPMGAGRTDAAGQWLWTPGLQGPPPPLLHPAGFYAGVYYATAVSAAGTESSPGLIVNGEVAYWDTANIGRMDVALFSPAGNTLVTDVIPGGVDFTIRDWTCWQSWWTAEVPILGAGSRGALKVCRWPLNPAPLKPGWSAPGGVTHWRTPTFAGVCNLFSFTSQPAVGLSKYSCEVLIGAAPAAGIVTPLNTAPWLQGWGVTCHAGSAGGWTVGSAGVDVLEGMTSAPVFLVNQATGDPAILTPS